MKGGRPFRASRGMTLVEVLAAVLLLSIIVTSVLQLYTQSWTVSALDEERMVASHLAQVTLEEWLVAHDYGEVQAKMADDCTRTLGNDAVLRKIWEELLPEWWGEDSFYETYAPSIELAHAIPGRMNGPIRVTVTISSKHDKGVTLHGVKAVPAS